MLTAPRAGRPPHRRDNLLAELRGQIVRGELPPGSRVPTREELRGRFNTGNPTVNDALQRLIREGFVVTHGTRGTFVAENPPHLCTYGLVLSRLQIESRYFRALRSAARAVFDSESRRLRVYESVCNEPSDPKNLQLIDDVAHHRVAGVVMTWEGNEFSDSALHAPDCDVPRVALHPTPVGGGVPSVVVDYETFFDRAVERLVARGRRKIACVVVGNNNADNTSALHAVKRHGLEFRRYWHLNIGALSYAAARTATHLLMSLAPDDRPDGLIIGDDNLVEHAQSGLIDAGVRVPKDLDVIGYCNWPEPPAAIFPITRLGFDITSLMRTCTGLIDQMRRGETPAESVSINPVFEEEAGAALTAGLADTSATQVI